MKDMPPDFLEGAKASPVWRDMVAQARSLRPDGESLAWAMSASHVALFGDIAVPVEVMYGQQTLPEMRAAADSLVSAIPGATQRQLPGAMHSWEPEPMAIELARFATAVPRDAHRVTRTAGRLGDTDGQTSQ